MSFRVWSLEFLPMKEANLRIHCGVSNSGDFPSECCTNLYQNHISTDLQCGGFIASFHDSLFADTHPN